MIRTSIAPAEPGGLAGGRHTLESPLPSARTAPAADRRAAAACRCGRASAARRKHAALLQGRTGWSRAAAGARAREVGAWRATGRARAALAWHIVMTLMSIER